MASGGYDDGYLGASCFWGTEPGSLVRRLPELVGSLEGLRVLDAGCGEGKNAAFLAALGAEVHAFDVSLIAVERARTAWPQSDAVRWEVADVRSRPLPDQVFDVVIAYGLLHCLANASEVVGVIERLQRATRAGGLHLLCAFNERKQDLRAHPGFHPVLLRHEAFLECYAHWTVLEQSDTDLVESHPHNAIEHSHSMTRMIARSPK